MGGKLSMICLGICIVCAFIPPLWIVDAILIPVAVVVGIIGIILGWLGI